MIVYGKASGPVAVPMALGEVDGWIAEALSASRPLERHAAWASALVAAGGLAQGLADVGAEDAEAAALDLATALAGVVGRSWRTGMAELPSDVPSAVGEAMARMRDAPGLPDRIEIRRPEGFAHYAVYPEALWQAAASLGEPRPTRVLGLRSIGAALGPCVAAALGATAPVTVRPQGHPFARIVTPGPRVAEAMRQGADAVWAVVDEGPGLSGSSFGAAADALGEAGVPPERLVLFPSHGGPPGVLASAAHRRLWGRARTAVLSFEALWCEGAGAGLGLGDWFADVTGPLLAPPEDVAGGGWRRHHYPDEADWPAVDRQNERRKYLLHGRKGRFLLRFTGLGSFGLAKFVRARALADAGFGVAPLGWRHGFLLEAWRGDLAPLAPGAVDRPALLHRLADYLAFRARAFPAAPHEGAPLDVLHAMARANTAEALGASAAERLDRWAVALPRLAAAARPVAIDGRLAPHEWLHDGRGPPVKADALDHCCGHDLVGCQDIAWDVAGAAAEHALSEDETEALRVAVALRSGLPCDHRLVAFMRIAYSAFAVGALTMARDRESGAEAGRLAATVATASATLGRALA